ncbi:MAG: radical SAM family heme chaperone HemW [Alphaproteobacteria bacterium]|nr:radical SAM family heme chaperone HemW [Alphaproteobacteria bacterium]MBU0797649.1 radical SAM family heme chaperone HemW [Alphaproteobacteria bacterium]MBU0886394.1 radical SAM family heme chaperone HemW [Alphaproteobacteria bacterium]MBU1813410.1 radical SAM family heme chaperone HemW [Alphaproteobacteria bacterium]
MTGQNGLAVYVHWPFCLSKCPYCDFNSHVSAGIDHARWRAALLREIDHYADRTPGRIVTSIFFGGGTPSLMEPATTAAVIEHIGRRWSLDDGVEITLEANPTSVESARLAGFRDAGVNRVSLGVQALNDADLKFLGREHSAADALAAVELAGRLFKRFSFDLIYARPGQNVYEWMGEMRRALSYAAGHLSVYQLTIEEGTPFYARHARGEFQIPDEDTAAALYEATQDVLGDAGLPAYEISNHARPGEESRHNLAYWRYGDYVGIGPGAHGRLTLNGEKLATRQHRAPAIWLDRVERDGHATQAALPVIAEERLTEMLMMGLRTVEGVPTERFLRETGQPLESALDSARLTRLVEGGFLIADASGLRATAEGRQRLNAVLPALLG